jgi:excisionase family DNA binding protein
MWTVPQTAAYLGFTESGVRKLITQRKLPALRIGTVYRIDPADVDAFITRVGDADESTGPGAA